MSHIYGMEKLHMAMFNLVGPGSMNSRLANAVNSHLSHISVGRDLPEELSDEYNAIIKSLKKEAKLTEIDAEHCAQKIVGLHEKLARLVH